MRRAVLLLALLVYPLSALGSDEADVLRARAGRLAAAGKCSEALPLFQRALASDPKEAQSALLAARCQIADKDYAAAEASLAEAARRDPALPGVPLEQAVARYHQDDFTGARSALEAARATAAGDARFELYDGFVLFREGKRREGIAALERARAADPKLADPVASYFEGVAWRNEGDAHKARESMRRAQRADPAGPFGTAASTRLDQWSTLRSEKYWASVTIGEELDSNVVLRGDDLGLPEDVADEKAFATVWSANAGLEFLRTTNWSAGAMVSYSGAMYAGLSDFNFHYPIGSIWVDRRLTERLTAHLQGDYGYAWVDGESWLRSRGVTPALEYLWDRDLYTRLFVRVYQNDYMFSRELDPADVEKQRDRDGHGELVGLDQGVPIDALSTRLHGGVFAGRYHAQGGEYDYSSYGAWARSETDLPWKLLLELGVAATYQPFHHHTTFPDSGDLDDSEKRRDRWIGTFIGLERPITDWAIAAVRWRYGDSSSSVSVFDYDRSVVGAYLTLQLP